MVKFTHTSIFLAITFIVTGCATTSGLQTYDIPNEGEYKTDQGAELNVVQISQQSLPAITQSTSLSQISHLFQNHQSTYRLSSGDVLSIQLWAYPEITPPVTDSGNARALGYTIDYNGNIYLPLVGQLKVAGKTLVEVNKLLKSQFSRFLKHPDAIVRVLSYEGRRYFVNGQEPGSDKFAYKMRWLDGLQQYVAQELAAHPRLALLGDFNITYDDRDTYDPIALAETIHHTSEERAHLQALLDVGLVDAFRCFEQADRSFSWWDYRDLAFRRKRGLRIDYVLASTALRAHLQACHIDVEPRKLERPSDHAPVVAEFAL